MKIASVPNRLAATEKLYNTPNEAVPNGTASFHIALSNTAFAAWGLSKTSLNVTCVEYLVRLVAAGLLKESIVNFLDSRVLVRTSHCACSILVVESLFADSADILKVAYRSRLLRLTAAVYAAPGTAHDLDKGVVGFAALYLLEKSCSVCSTRSNRNLNVKIANLVGGFLDSLNAADFRKVDVSGFLDRKSVV